MIFIGRTTFILMLILSLSRVSIAQPAGYGYGKQITIDATEVIGGSPFSNFPIMVRFMGAGADNDLKTSTNGGHVEHINGYDIIFTSDQAGTVVLDHQIEFYYASTGEYVAWVRIPTLSNATDTDIFMYYGNCSVSTDPATTAVWNSDFDAVYFMHDDFADYTANGNTGTNSGSTDASPALIADGQTFAAASSDYIQVPTASLSAAQGTISVWAYSTSFSGNPQYMFGHTTVPAFANRIQLYTDDATGLLDLGLGDSHFRDTNFYDLNTNEWYYITLTWDGTNYIVYVNGTSTTSGTYAGLGTLIGFADIGNHGLASDRSEPWAGDLDHIRLSNEVFNADWIQTEYNNQKDASSFYLVSGELAGNIYYSLTTGNWDDNTSWSLTSDGSSGALAAGIWPSRNDNVVIRNGHTITVNAIDDNNACGISPDGLNRSNVGTFTSSNVSMFYQTGNIIVDAGGTLSVTTRSIYEGFTYINGTFTSTADIINLGNMEITSSATFNTDDDLILSGNSATTFNNTSTSDDDIYLDHTDATLCGTGTFNIGSDAGNPLNPVIQYLNSATEAQICASLTIICSVNCGGFTPPANPGNFSLGFTGPGGVAGTDGSTELVLWLDANTISQGTGTNLSTWSDLSGYGNDAVAPGGNEPVFNTGQLNGFPAVAFTAANSDYLAVTDDTSLDPATISLFVVGNMTNSSSAFGGFVTKVNNAPPAQGYFMARNASSQQARMLINSSSNTSLGTISYGQYDVLTGIYDQSNIELFINEASQGQDPYAVAIAASGDDMLIGATDPSPIGRFLDGDIAEAIVINRDVNLAERIIIDNYLAAKYDRTLTNNNVYEMDDVANGDYDYEVAGIGQANDGSFHKDARGPGIVRMNLPSGLDNDEFLLWGHENTSLSSVNEIDVDGAIIEARLERVWRLSMNDNAGIAVDVGTVNLTMDVSSVPPTVVGSDLRLLISRDDAFFADNDVTPLAGSYNVENQLITFSNVDFDDGDYFTLGTTDNTSSPLPIELISFSAKVINGKVELVWRTASEQNNDFFTIERSDGIGEWQGLDKIVGAGNSLEEISYSYWDTKPLIGLNYYRLKQTDFDGRSTYSRVELVSLQQADLITIYPNPFSDSFTLYGFSESDETSLEMLSLLGAYVSIEIEYQNNQVMVRARNLATGIYILKAIINQSVRTYRVVKE